MVATSSLMPRSSTVWLPTGQPARVSSSTASAASAVSSFGWLKWVFTQIGWWRSSRRHSASVTREGSVTGRRVPSRISSTWGIARNSPSSQSSLSSEKTSGSPPVSSTSRIAGVARIHVERGLQLALLHRPLGLADHALAQAVAAVERALVVHAEGDAIAVHAHHVLHRRVRHLVERIGEAGRIFEFGEARHHLAADRALRIGRVHQRRVVRRDHEAEAFRQCVDRAALVVAGRHECGERGGAGDAVLHLPGPVAPVAFGDAGRHGDARPLHQQRPSRRRPSANTSASRSSCVRFISFGEDPERAVGREGRERIDLEEDRIARGVALEVGAREVAAFEGLVGADREGGELRFEWRVEASGNDVRERRRCWSPGHGRRCASPPRGRAAGPAARAADRCRSR